MTVLLVGGPKAGEVMDIPEGLSIFRVTVANVEALPLTEGLYHSTQIADYEFSGQAYVDIQGNLQSVVYRFVGME